MIEPLIKITLLVAGLMTGAAYMVLVERRVAAWVQDRLGPNRVGIPLTNIRVFGLGQPIADGVKFLAKEEFTPGHVDRWLYFAAPVAMLTAAIAVFAVVPFGSVLPPVLGSERPIPLVVAPGVDVGALFVMAMGGLAVYGVLLGGWASNNKYSLFGGLRSAAQLIAYELPLGLGVLGVVLASGSLRLDAIIAAQAASGTWNAMAQPLGLLVFAAAAFAESGRLPFDLAEAEQELVGGYHTEYSGIKLMMFLVGEYLHMFVASFLLVIFFFGGWHLWGATGAGDAVSWPVALLRVVVLLGKVFVTILFFMLARWSWPRFRFDQLMALAWKVLLPLGLVNAVAVAAWNEYGRQWASTWGVSYEMATAAWGWIVLILAGAVVLAIAPAQSDNRPRLADVEAWRADDPPRHRRETRE